MKQPIARPTGTEQSLSQPARVPRAFAPAEAERSAEPFEDETEDLPPPPPRRRHWLSRLLWTAGGILLSAGLGLAADRLIRDLYAANPWLGWAGLAVLALFVVALVALAAREWWSVRRLKVLDGLRRDAADAVLRKSSDEARSVVRTLETIYADRPDLARARSGVAENLPHLFDGPEIVALAERSLMSPLDARARALTAASARRVALVTAISPRALVDIAFILYESIRLAGAIATLYGARPGLLGYWRLLGSVLAHLAVTGGLVLTDGIVEQLVGQGLAAKVSQRLGEGVVNGLMTVRVGIAAMRVVRPLPFTTQPSPQVRDFIPELTRVTREAAG
jgi:putative membrane protein